MKISRRYILEETFTKFEFQRKSLIFTGTICPVLDLIRRDIRQQLETEANAKYREVFTSLVDFLRNPIYKVGEKCHIHANDYR